MNFKVNKLWFLFIGVLVIILIIFYLLYSNISNSGYLKKEIDKENFKVKYIKEPSIEWYSKMEISIDAQGNYTQVYYGLFQSDTKVIKGTISTEKLKEFLSYVIIKRNFFEIDSNLDSNNITDGNSHLFEITLSGNTHLIGGYEPSNTDYSRIYSKFKWMFGEEIRHLSLKELANRHK